MYTDDLKPEPCPFCDSEDTYYDSVFDFHKCRTCSKVWSDGSSDPDYEDGEPTDLIDLL